MWTYINKGSITSVNGIKAAGIHCGLKKKKKDLALIYSEYESNAAGTFTLNKVKAAPLIISKNILNSGKKVRAVLINSGNANACTGPEGYQDALNIKNYCASKLNLKNDELLISSTGVIGQRLPEGVIDKGIDSIIDKLSYNGGQDAAEAIMTTDLKPKSFALKVELSKGTIVIGGICKGSGMIMPNMATMLAFIATDASVEKQLLQKVLIEAVNNSFNKISVDGDTSTNDMVILLANGTSKIKINKNSNDLKIFSNALVDFMQLMAKAIVADGEGATKLINIKIKNAGSKKDADITAKTIANSPLVKTAFYGRDANWGRIISAIGNSGAKFKPENITIRFDDVPVLDKDLNVVLNEEKAKNVLSNSEITLEVDLNEGKHTTTWWTCDLTEDYVKINANYRT